MHVDDPDEISLIYGKKVFDDETGLCMSALDGISCDWDRILVVLARILMIWARLI